LGRGAGRQLGLDPQAGLRQLLQPARGQRRHAEPLVGRIDRQGPLGHQPPHGVAHRHRRHAQLGGQAAQADPDARRDAAGDQGLADGLVDLVVDGRVVGEGLAGFCSAIPLLFHSSRRKPGPKLTIRKTRQ
jgi:hypothetical protein